MCKRVLYSAEFAMQLFSAAATARVRLSHQHANPVLRRINQSSGRWVTLTVLEPCRDSPQLLTSVLKLITDCTHLHTLMSGGLTQDSCMLAGSHCSQPDRLDLVCMCCQCLQVFYCSRTHSQLSQFISELQRTSFADTVASVALASRKVSNTYRLIVLCHNFTDTLSGR